MRLSFICLYAVRRCAWLALAALLAACAGAAPAPAQPAPAKLSGDFRVHDPSMITPIRIH